MTSTPDRHSIAVASRLTGIPIETLRVWERRYGFPKPERTEGTLRRVYRAGEIDRLRWVARALARGFRAGDVVPKKVSEIEALLQATSGEPTAALDAPSPSTLSSIDDLVRVLATDDVSRFESELRRLAAAHGPARFVTEIAHPLAVAIGAAWERGELEVRQEHFASEALITQLRHLLSSLQDVRGGPVVVLATLPGEPHSLALAMVAVYLAVNGATPRLVGASTPPDQIATAARALHADVVGLTITPVSVTPALDAQLHALAEALPRGTRLWLGGAGAPPSISRRRVRVVRDWPAIDEALAELRS